MKYVGPCKINCPLSCNVPEGYELSEIPMPRHGWGDVRVCPNTDEDTLPPGEVCGRAFYVTKDDKAM